MYPADCISPIVGGVRRTDAQVRPSLLSTKSVHCESRHACAVLARSSHESSLKLAKVTLGAKVCSSVFAATAASAVAFRIEASWPFCQRFVRYTPHDGQDGLSAFMGAVGAAFVTFIIVSASPAVTSRRSPTSSPALDDTVATRHKTKRRAEARRCLVDCSPARL